MMHPSETNPGVNFREVAGFPAYLIGDDGTAWKNLNPWRKLPGAKAAGGYLTISLTEGKQKLSKKAHTLVLEAFVGPRPPGMQCCHYDGNPANNRLDNLRWDTPLANAADKVRQGRLRRKSEPIEIETRDGHEWVSAHAAARILRCDPIVIPWCIHMLSIGVRDEFTPTPSYLLADVRQLARDSRGKIGKRLAWLTSCLPARAV